MSDTPLWDEYLQRQEQTLVDREIDAFNLVTRSLRANLVPAVTWLKNFKRLEEFGPMVININTDVYALQRGWMVPYAYSTGAYRMYFKNMKKMSDRSIDLLPFNLSAVNQQDIEMIKAMVDARAEGYLDSVISDEMVSEIDNNYNYGTFIRGLSGTIIPFDYSQVESITFTTMPMRVMDTFARYMIPLAETQEDIEHIKASIISMKDVLDTYLLYMCINYKTENGDRFNRSPVGVVNLSEQSPYSQYDIPKLIRCITTAYKAHSKVIGII